MHSTGTAAEALIQARDAGFVPLETVAPNAPRSLRTVVQKAMALSQADRYQSATELATALEDVLAQAVTGEEPLLLRAGVTVVAGVAVLGLLVVTVAVVSMFRTTFVYNPLVSLVLLMSIAGMVLSVIEWKTSGRHRLEPLSVAFAGASILLGLVLTLLGVSATMKVLSERSAEWDPNHLSNVAAMGLHESMGALITSATLTAIQVLLWGISRRAVNLVRMRGGFAELRSTVSPSEVPLVFSSRFDRLFFSMTRSVAGGPLNGFSME